jgi:hypothetical protein
MAVLYIYESPIMPARIYDRVIAQILKEGFPDGAICHVAATRDDGGLFAMELWKSQDAYDAFDVHLRDLIKKAGGPPRPNPRILDVYYESYPRARTH